MEVDMRRLTMAVSAVLLIVPALVLAYGGGASPGGRDGGGVAAEARPPVPIEHRLTSGAMELHTRYGRFCIMPTPAYPYSDLATNLTLASRCAKF